MDPPDEHLAACGCVGHNVVLWLDVDSKLVVLQSVVHIVDYLLLLFNAQAHIVIIILKVIYIVALAVLCGKGGSVEHYRDGDILLARDVNSETGHDIVSAGEILQRVHASHNEMLHRLLVRIGHADTEDISLQTTEGTARKVRGVNAQVLCDIFEQRISFVHTEE